VPLTLLLGTRKRLLIPQGNPDTDYSKIERIIEWGGEIVGATSGAVIGTLLGGPIGATIGAGGGLILQEVFVKAGTEFSQRVLAPRERMRVGAATYYAIEAIKRKLEGEEHPRDDGFFEAELGFRSKADEILEGVLLKSKDAFEEKKIVHLGRFYANVAFSKEISAERSSLFLYLFERLTFRQLCLIQVISQPHRYRLRASELSNKRIIPEAWAALQEIYEMTRMNLVRQEIASGGQVDLFWGLGAIAPQRLRLTSLGLDMNLYFSLNEIAKEDLEIAVRYLLEDSNVELP